MSTIGSRVFVVGGEDKYLTLANEEYVRPLVIGNSWNRLRIGILMAANPDSTNNLLSCAWVLGVCSGVDAPYGAASTTNFVGMGLTTPGAFTYNAGTGGASFFTANASQTTKVAASVASGSSLGSVYHTTSGAYAQRRCAQIVDITKGSPNYTVTLYSEQNITAHTQYDLNYATFIYAMEQGGTPNFSANNMGTATGNIAASETPGPLNAVDLFWNRASFPWEIYAIAVYRFS